MWVHFTFSVKTQQRHTTEMLNDILWAQKAKRMQKSRLTVTYGATREQLSLFLKCVCP